jgi:hypothetical protein
VAYMCLQRGPANRLGGPCGHGSQHLGRLRSALPRHMYATTLLCQMYRKIAFEAGGLSTFWIVDVGVVGDMSCVAEELNAAALDAVNHAHKDLPADLRDRAAAMTWDVSKNSI